MSLRKKKGIYYDLDLGEFGKVKYRGFTVGETKEILVARGVGDSVALTNTMVKTISQCVEGVDVDTLPMYLMDFLFIKIYSKAGGDKLNVRYNCPGDDCDHSMLLQLDLGNTEIEYPEGFEEKRLIDVGDDMHIKLRVPNFSQFRQNTLDEVEDANNIDRVIYSGIECVVDGDTVKVPGVDFTEQELIDWLNDLDATVLTQLEDFFVQFPGVVLKTRIKCPACGHDEEYTIRDLESFLA